MSLRALRIAGSDDRTTVGARGAVYFKKFPHLVRGVLSERFDRVTWNVDNLLLIPTAMSGRRRSMPKNSLLLWDHRAQFYSSVSCEWCEYV